MWLRPTADEDCWMLDVQVSSSKPDGFTPTLIKRTDEYVYFEFQSPTFGFIDDVRVRLPVFMSASFPLWL
jgi:uncharacterized protein (DUF1499 family)